MKFVSILKNNILTCGLILARLEFQHLWLTKFQKQAKQIHTIFYTNHLYPRFKGNNATQHGKISEPIAKEIFEKKFDVKVKKLLHCYK